MISFCRFVPKLFLMIAVISTLVITPASAEPQTITATGEYMMGEGETMLVAKERALEQAMRAAAEQAGVYIESYSQTNNLTLTKDEISILARGVVEVIDKQYDEPKYVEGGFHLRVTITARVSTDNIETLRKSMQDKSNIDDLKRLQAAYDQSQQELTQLKQQLIQAQGDEKKKVEQSIAQNEQEFTAKQWLERGLYLVMKQKDYGAAVQAFNEAIGINPQDKEAYSGRGYAYLKLKQFDQAMADCNKAITIDPQYAKPYCVLGMLYFNLHQYDQAMVNENKAIVLDPQAYAAYSARGIVHSYFHRYDLAMADFDKAIAINPKYGDGYVLRSTGHINLRQNEQAIADCDKAIAIDPKIEGAYYCKGMALSNLNRKPEAIEAYKQFLQLSSNTEMIGKVKEMIKKLGGTLDQ